jgi:hypothetical protein
MRIVHTISLVGCLVIGLTLADAALAGEGRPTAFLYNYAAARTPWHGMYYDPAWGMPTALVVPPNAETQTHYGWGVGNYRVTGIYHQYHRNWPGPGVYDKQAFRPTPPSPSDTDQLGIYYVRGPW